MKMIIIPLIIVLLIGLGYLYKDEVQAKIKDINEVKEHPLTLYGNIDNRTINLAFSLSERIAHIIPEEGMTVKKGDLLGSLETVRIENEIEVAKADIKIKEAAVNYSKSRVERLKNGSRQEDIAIIKSLNAALESQVKYNKDDMNRQKNLLKNNAISAQSSQLSETNFTFYNALLAASKNALNRFISGEREDDIETAKIGVEQAQAALERAEIELKIKKQKLADTKLYAPCDGIIRNRLLEPGEMSTPQMAAINMAVISPKWIRCYLNEALLTKVKIGDKAIIKCDGADKDFEGWVGFVAPNAEFTPKNIETEDLRTNLVYEIRIFLEDSDNLLKLGAPATVVFKNILVK